MLRHTELGSQLAMLGIERGSVIVVHTSFSRVGLIEYGPRGLIDALRETLGPDGTLVMPSMSDDDDQPFDVARTPCPGMGVVAETFWRLPGVRRSDSPHAFAAVGPRAEEIVAPHPWDFPHGPDSPIGRVHALAGLVLLLGIGHDANTTIHLAESMAGVRYRRHKQLTVVQGGRPTKVQYDEIDHCCERFALLDEWLGGSQHRGIVGRATARLMRARDVVAAAMDRLRRDETVFLHDGGTCEQCEQARASLPRG